MTYPTQVLTEAKRLHHEAIVFDGCTFFCEGYNDNIARSGSTVLNITVPNVADDVGGAVKNIANYYHVINKDPKLCLIETVDDIFEAKKRGLVGIVIGAQNCRPMEYYDLDSMVEAFYRLGMRISQLTYNTRNFAGDGCGTEANAGLSRDGRELIKAMNRVGIVLDLSHVGEQTSLEAIEESAKPPVFTHSNPRSRVDVPRNITDEQIKKVAEKGGVVGLTPYPPMNWKGGEEIPTLGDYLDNMEYIIDLVGIDHVAVGTDSVATPGAYPREEIVQGLRTAHLTVGNYFKFFRDRTSQAMSLKGFTGMADYPLITQGLLDRGHDGDSIIKILGLNMIRVFQEVW